MRRLACLLILGATILGPSSARAQTEREDLSVRRAIESVLELDTGRQQAIRLPRVSIDAATGDLTIVFAMRRPLADDPAQIVASATDDVFNILWATYSSPSAERIRTTTVLGTYAVVGRYSRAREIPVLRAVLSADRAAQLDWNSVATIDPSDVLDVWWVEGELPH